MNENMALLVIPKIIGNQKIKNILLNKEMKNRYRYGRLPYA
jgi:hypothetical protein